MGHNMKRYVLVGLLSCSWCGCSLVPEYETPISERNEEIKEEHLESERE